MASVRVLKRLNSSATSESGVSSNSSCPRVQAIVAERFARWGEVIASGSERHLLTSGEKDLGGAGRIECGGGGGRVPDLRYGAGAVPGQSPRTGVTGEESEPGGLEEEDESLGKALGRSCCNEAVDPLASDSELGLVGWRAASRNSGA